MAGGAVNGGSGLTNWWRNLVRRSGSSFTQMVLFWNQCCSNTLQSSMNWFKGGHNTGGGGGASSDNGANKGGSGGQSGGGMDKIGGGGSVMLNNSGGGGGGQDGSPSGNLVEVVLLF